MMKLKVFAQVVGFAFIDYFRPNNSGSFVIKFQQHSLLHAR
jgi:hypothetical protein